MRIVITGGTGLVGSKLVPALMDRGYEVVVLTRNTAKAQKRLGKNVEIVKWDPYETELPREVLEGCYGVVNLAGETLNKRWTAARKEQILRSRIKTTAGLVKAMQNAKNRPEVFVSTSAVGYYDPRDEARLTEETPAGTDFPAKVCKKWEEEALQVEALGIRIVLLRLGVVLDSEGGALPKMLRPYQFFAGGPVGSGRQWFSWIHHKDLIEVILYALTNSTLTGPVNTTAPQPVTNQQFAKILGQVLHRPAWLSVPAFIMKLAFGEMAGMLLNGQRVMPEKLLQAGFEFKFPSPHQALEDLLS